MSADKTSDLDLTEPKITIDDVKRRAEAVRDLAKAEARTAANELLHDRVARTVAVGAVVVVSLVSIAHFMGMRKGKASCPTLPPYHCLPPE